MLTRAALGGLVGSGAWAGAAGGRAGRLRAEGRPEAASKRALAAPTVALASLKNRG